MTSKIRIAAFSTMLLLVVGTNMSFAQTVVRAIKLGSPANASLQQVTGQSATLLPGQVPVLPPGVVAAGDVVVEEVKSPRLTETLSLQFNRSPVSVLKAWSLRNNPPAPKKTTPIPPGPDTPGKS